MLERRAIDVRGIVQGVGFRPFVHALAHRHTLAGFVQNRVGSVHIEVEGPRHAIDAFHRDLTASPPPASSIHDIAARDLTPRGDTGFTITPSDTLASAVPQIGPDLATCAACLAEIQSDDPRRGGYAFVTCADCGPRFTVVTGAPYDRERTTLSEYPMCGGCRREHKDPRDRRFHAEGITCRVCGPHVHVSAARFPYRAARADEPGSLDAPLVTAARALLRGEIVAIKGIGGYHLACLARDEPAARELRRRKARDDKPFAVLARDLDEARRVAHVTSEEVALLESPARPIVLLHARDGALAPSVAPRSHLTGVMLPYTPLHHLLCALLAAEGGDRATPIVLTSANRAGEPIPFDDADAAERLTDLADLTLGHDRRIASRCDDSVVRVVLGAPTFLRRSRGYAPSTAWLPWRLARPTLAVGGHKKSTFCLGRGDVAVISHHLGDLDHPDAEDAFLASIRAYEALYGVRPERVVHDLHPDYVSTRHALERAAAEGLERVAIQHHHAHLAACLAERGVTRRALGVILDGTGAGLDGTVWGGEFLVGDASRSERAGHLACVPLPGGERAVREGFRMATAHAIAAGLDPTRLRFARRVGSDRVERVAALARSRALAPLTSSAGRLFDAVASLAGVRDIATFDGQAAMELEALASQSDDEGTYPHALTGAADDLCCETAPLFLAASADVETGVDPRRVARRFHRGLADLLVAAAARLCEHHGVTDVALSGGVFANAVLVRDVVRGLIGRGLTVHRHELLPPGDGGLSFGQLAAVAAADST